GPYRHPAAADGEREGAARFYGRGSGHCGRVGVGMKLVDTQAEAALLGYYLQRGLDGFLSWQARAHFFVGRENRLVFEAIERLVERSEAPEPFAVQHELERGDAGVRADVLADIVDQAAVSGGDVLRILEDLAERRAMDRAGQHL